MNWTLVRHRFASGLQNYEIDLQSCSWGLSLVLGEKYGLLLTLHTDRVTGHTQKG